MIRCRITQRLLSKQTSPAEHLDQQQVSESSNSIDEAGGVPAPSTAAASRCPRPMPKSSSARNSRAGKQVPQRGNWLLSHLCNKSPQDDSGAELYSFHLATLEEGSCSEENFEETTTGDDSFMEMSPDWSSSRAERDDLVIEEAEVKSPGQMLDGDIVSAIKNVVNDAVESFSGQCSYDSMESVADDLLSELGKAAAQVAGMEAEIKSLKERVEQDEVRRSHLEEELAFHKQADELAASVSHLQKTSTEQATCTSGRHNCSEQLTSYEQRLAFLEDICRNKDATIMGLEQEINSLQTKLTDLFKDEPQTIASSPPATIKELLVKLGSDHQSTSELRESKKKLSGKKSGRKINSSSSNNNKNILVDLTPNLLDRTNQNPAKKLKF